MKKERFLILALQCPKREEQIIYQTIAKEKLPVEQNVLAFCFGETNPAKIVNLAKDKRPKNIVFENYTSEQITAITKTLRNRFKDRNLVFFAVKRAVEGVITIMTLGDAAETGVEQTEAQLQVA